MEDETEKPDWWPSDLPWSDTQTHVKYHQVVSLHIVISKVNVTVIYKTKILVNISGRILYKEAIPIVINSSAYTIHKISFYHTNFDSLTIYFNPLKEMIDISHVCSNGCYNLTFRKFCFIYWYMHDSYNDELFTYRLEASETVFWINLYQERSNRNIFKAKFV